MNRRSFLKVAGFSVASFASAGWNEVLSKPSAKRPNILLLMTDQQFADAMSCAIGNEYINTPAMDSLAATGIRFTRAYCANPICQPSRTSMFTGRYPHETGIQDNAAKGFDVKKYPMMGKIFRDAGYDTGYSAKWHIRFNTSPHNPQLSKKDTDIHGFDFIDQTRVNSAESRRKGDFGRVAPGIEFIQKKRDKPFLLVVSCMNPHNICEWARGQRLPDGAIGEPPPLDQCPPLKDNHLPPKDETDIMAYMRWNYQHTSSFPVSGFDDKKWRQYIWAYYRMIEMVDGEIGKVLTALRETGQEKDTVVVFMSDHGDCHGAHKWNQKTVFYDESARVPLIISWKGKTPQGTSNILLNTGVDLIPTLCDFVGIDAPSDLPGKSLKEPALGRAPAWKREYVVSQNHMTQGRGIGEGTPEERRANKLKPYGRMVRSDHYKYCVYSEGEQTAPLVDIKALSGERKELERQRLLLRNVRQESLIDMKNDPCEMKNLAKDGAYRKILEQHRRYLEDFCQKYGDDFSAPKT